jgi:hypothetical protein
MIEAQTSGPPAPVAQRIELLSSKQQVAGSSPARGTPNLQLSCHSFLALLALLRAALVLWRRQEHRIGSGSRSRNLLACCCPCGRRIRAAKATLTEAPILCGACQEPFEPEEPED